MTSLALHVRRSTQAQQSSLSRIQFLMKCPRSASECCSGRSTTSGSLTRVGEEGERQAILARRSAAAPTTAGIVPKRSHMGAPLAGDENQPSALCGLALDSGSSPGFCVDRHRGQYECHATTDGDITAASGRTLLASLA